MHQRNDFLRRMNTAQKMEFFFKMLKRHTSIGQENLSYSSGLNYIQLDGSRRIFVPFFSELDSLPVIAGVSGEYDELARRVGNQISSLKGSAPINQYRLHNLASIFEWQDPQFNSSRRIPDFATRIE